MDFAEVLGKYLDYVPVCPEVGIGLGVPRATLRLIREGSRLRLVQPSTGLDFTDEMSAFSERFLDSLKEVDGFLLKSKSPSSGFSGARIYLSADKTATAVAKGRGLFAAKVVERYPRLPVEDEGRLADADIRNHFLTRVFVLREFRMLRSRMRGLSDLAEFHRRHKLLLSTYSQRWAKEMGRVIAHHDHGGFAEVTERYQEVLSQVFLRKASYRAHINTLLHALGYVSGRLSASEKRHFLDLLDKYGNHWVPLMVPLEVMKSFISRFQECYLMKQTYFSPYPEELLYYT